MEVLLLAMVSLIVPLPDRAEPHTQVSIAVANSNDVSVTCLFHVGETTTHGTVSAHTARKFPQPDASDGLVRISCSDAVSITSMVESSNGGATLSGRYEASMLEPRSKLLIEKPGSSITIGEATGVESRIRMTWRKDGRGVRSVARTLAPWQTHTTRLTEGAELLSNLSLEVEVETEGGGVMAFSPLRATSRDPAKVLDRSRVSSAMTEAEGPDLSSSAFKAAPFHDPATGLVYLRARWYDTKSGGFIAPDPMGYRDSSNPYSFAAGDPVNASDPTGLALYAFDGTWNDRDQMKNDTNVAKLAALYLSGGISYQKGVGTAWPFKTVGGLTGAGASARVRAARDDLERMWNEGDQEIDVIGFSRGAATALAFANKLARYGVMDFKLGTRVFPRIRFMGLFDTVGSFGVPGNKVDLMIDLTLPPNIEHVRHAIARDEYRSAFPLTRMTNSKCRHPDVVEKDFSGAHSDVGGGYEDNDMLSRVPLQWMWQQMVDAGIEMDPLSLESGIITPGAEVVQHRSHRSLKFANDWARIEAGNLIGRKPQRRIFTTPCYETWH